MKVEFVVSLVSLVSIGLLNLLLVRLISKLRRFFEILFGDRGLQLEPMQHLGGVFRILHYQRLGQFEFQRAACDGGMRQHGAKVVDQIVPQQLAR